MWKSSKLLAGLAVVLSLCACKEDKSEVQNAAAKTAALPVNVLEVAAEDVPLSFEFSARAQGYKETERHFAEEKLYRRQRSQRGRRFV